MPFRQLFLWCCLLATVFALTACGETALTRTIRAAVPAFGSDVDTLPLHPQRTYLRVSARGKTALMVLGYRTSHPDGNIDVWYSSQGETLYLQNGRIIATAGLETDWISVKYPKLPTWSEMTKLRTHVYRRQRDEMPGYHYGISEQITLSAVPPPLDSKLVGIAARDMEWFDENVDAASANPPSRFAISRRDARVVYSEHCLSVSLCLALQEWPVRHE